MMMTPTVKKSIAIRSVELYGNALSRPRFFVNPQFRLQGRIEGDVGKLRAQLESSSAGDSEKKKKKKRCGCDSPPPPASPVAVKRRRYFYLNDDNDEGEDEGAERIIRNLSDDFDEEEEDEGVVARIIRNLSDDFDRVGGESKFIKKSIESAGKRLKEKKKSLRVEETSSTTRASSPRLTKPLCFR